MQNIDIKKIRDAAVAVQRNSTGQTPLTRPVKGNSSWPTYELATCVVALCDALEELRKPAGE